MTRKAGKLDKVAARATFLDLLHLAAVLTCSVWTAKLIVEERFGGFGRVATRFVEGAAFADNGYTVTISLDDSARTAAR